MRPVAIGGTAGDVLEQFSSPDGGSRGDHDFFAKTKMQEARLHFPPKNAPTGPVILYRSRTNGRGVSHSPSLWLRHDPNLFDSWLTPRHHSLRLMNHFGCPPSASSCALVRVTCWGSITQHETGTSTRDATCRAIGGGTAGFDVLEQFSSPGWGQYDHVIFAKTKMQEARLHFPLAHGTGNIPVPYEWARR